jgi:threonine/homoserine/homoserine lactone efflux protein
MKFSWLLNGTMEAHHLAAVYIVVWVIQGGYACWIAWQMLHTRKDSRRSAPLVSATRDQP